MRFMMLMIPNNRAYEAGAMPSSELVAHMTRYNQELADAGMLISLDGLHSSTNGARVSFSGGKTTVMDGPFSEAREVIGGFWMIRADSKEQAVEWAQRCPAEEGDVIEIRQVFELSDFPAEIQEAARLATSPSK